MQKIRRWPSKQVAGGRFVAVLMGCLVLFAGCTPARLAPVEERYQPPSEKITEHWVSRGETLYAIAWRYNLDASELAAANYLRPPYRIYHGQKLTLDMRAAKAANRIKPKRQPTVSSRLNLGRHWQWPVGASSAGQSNKGLSTRFSWRQTKRQQSGHKGIDIVGQRGDSVLATQAGKVVYAGTGLSAYGKLLIVKHNETYLSAYAHNDRLLVAEGDAVKQGQKIAEMGSTGTRRVHLHFEIRKHGVPIDPLVLLKSG